MVLPRNKSASLYDCEHSCDEDWYHIIVDIMLFTLIAIVMIAHNNEITTVDAKNNDLRTVQHHDSQVLGYLGYCRIFGIHCNITQNLGAPKTRSPFVPAKRQNPYYR